MGRKKHKQQYTERDGWRVSKFFLDHGRYCTRIRRLDEEPEVIESPSGKKRYKYESTRYWRSDSDNIAIAHEEFNRWFEDTIVSGIENKKQLTVEALFREWIDSPEIQVRQPTYDSYHNTLFNIIAPAFEKCNIRKINQVTPADIRVVMKVLGKRKDGTSLSGRTMVKRLSLLKRIFSWAVDNQYLKDSPVKFIAPKIWRKQIRDSRYRGIALSEEESRRLLIACKQALKINIECKRGLRKDKSWIQENQPKDFLFLFCLLGLSTGLRRSNLIGLRWKHLKNDLTEIDLPGGEIKTGNRLHIPVSSEVTHHLKKHLQKQSEKKVPSGDDFVLNIPSIKRTTTTEVKKSFQRAVNRAGLNNLTDALGREQTFRIHDMRHTASTRFASYLPQAVKDALVGHAPVSMSLRYTHFSVEDLRKHLEVIPWFFPEERERQKKTEKGC